ncbi:BolA family transcriptional regulator, general stress-responsive regulator [Gammaproteobacteria bacterium]
MSIRNTLEKKLTEAFSPSHLEIIDESDRHVGHAGYREGGESHFHVTLVSSQFAGLSLLQRHRLVYRVLKDELAGPVHALQLTTRTAAEE